MKPIVTQEPLHEHWRDYSAREISKIKLSKCKDCPYHSYISGGSSDSSYVYCNYIGATGELRGVRIEMCEHFKDEEAIDKSQYKYRGVGGWKGATANG